MKKTIAFLLCLVLLCAYGMPILSAADSGEEAPSYETLREHSITYSCNYDKENAKILISGTVNHDVMITHSDFVIDVYRILPGGSVSAVMESEEAEPLASTAIAIKFQFSVSAPSVADRFSRYAIVLIAPDGTKILAGEPQYVDGEATYAYDAEDRSSFKGISSQQTSITGLLGFGTAVIPVYLDEAFSTVSHGYLYLLGDTNHYFDQNYINRLDAQIRTYSASGTRVYLQFLLPASQSELSIAKSDDVGAEYDMPDVFSSDVLSRICAISEFLALRYDNYQSGHIDGIIVGRQIDQRRMNDHGGLSLLDYAEQYAFYVMVVANSARFYQSELDIVIPFGNINVYADKDVKMGANNYTPSALLEEILSVFESSLSVPLPCNVLIESSTVPFGISNAMLEEGNIDIALITLEKLHTETVYQFIQYLHTLQDTYDTAPQHMMYVWSVPSTLSGDALDCAYAYSYYRLLQEEKISSFVVSFLDAEKQGARSVQDMKQLLRYIDTEESLVVTERLLSHFNVDSWERVINHFEKNDIAQRNVYHSSVTEAPKQEWTGEFSYFDFASGDIGDWFAGTDCQKISSMYGVDRMRGLSATMKKTEDDSYAELLCLYEYSENFVYTPMMRFTVALTDTGLSSDALYELVITIGDESSSLTSEHLVRGNSLTELWVDLREYNEDVHLANYLKISVRSLHGEAEEYSLWVYDVVGMSEEYSSEELATLISAERLRIRDEALNDDEEDQNRDLILMVFGIMLTVTLVGASLYIGIYRNKRKEKDNESANGNL